MFWSDKFAEQIIKSAKHKPYWVDDMKTPSGRVHVGALRGVVIHDLINQSILSKEKKSTYTYVLNDMDPMDGFPHYLPKKFKKHMGEPLYKIPSPEKGHNSMAKLYGQEFIDVFNKLGIKPQIIWSSEYYQQGKFNQIIKQALDKVKLIRKLYHDISGYDKPKNWYPYQVICPQCGKVGTTIVTDWDGQKVTFECKQDLVKWAQGCGYKGEIEPINDNGKLMWKTDWAAHWKVIGVTVEGAGKDHMTEGGSHDLSKAICQQVFDYPTPYNFLYEWFLVKGGVKMSSSKGIGISAAEISQTLPPEILKFLLTRTSYKKAIIFDPNNNESMLDLFDEYDRLAGLYYQQGEKDDLAKVWQLSQVDKIPDKPVFLPRFRDVVKYIQDPKTNINKKFEEIKNKPLTSADKQELDKRIKYAQIWLKTYAPEEKVFAITSKIPEVAAKLSDKQRKFLSLASEATMGSASPDKLQQELYDISKKVDLPVNQAFGTAYEVLLDKKYGPKAGWLLFENKEFASKRLKEAANYRVEKKDEKISYKFKIINKPEIIEIGKDMVQTYPSMKVAMVVIKGVNNTKAKAGFEEYRNRVVNNLQGVTVEDINDSRKIKAYRQAIKESGIDWHKRRPTMEALLRRIALGKDLTWINPLVDIGNLIAMKHHASQGVFDLDKLRLPAVMKKAAGGEKVLMLGDKEEMTLKKGEICYFDQEGPFIVDLCWRDAQRTGATAKTKNVLFLSEAVHDITKKDLDEVLEDLIKIVTKYLGGKVEVAGFIEPK